MICMIQDWSNHAETASTTIAKELESELEPGAALDIFSCTGSQADVCKSVNQRWHSCLSPVADHCTQSAPSRSSFCAAAQSGHGFGHQSRASMASVSSCTATLAVSFPWLESPQAQVFLPTADAAPATPPPAFRARAEGYGQPCKVEQAHAQVIFHAKTAQPMPLRNLAVKKDKDKDKEKSYECGCCGCSCYAMHPDVADTSYPFCCNECYMVQTESEEYCKANSYALRHGWRCTNGPFKWNGQRPAHFGTW